MTLDALNTITPLQSDTIRSALKVIAANVVALVAVITGKTFDIQSIQAAIDFGVPQIVNLISLYYGYRAYRGRMRATQAISTSPQPATANVPVAPVNGKVYPAATTPAKPTN